MSLKESLKEKANGGNGVVTEVKPEAKKKSANMEEWLVNAYEDGNFKNLLAGKMTEEDFLSMGLRVIKKDPKIALCTKESLRDALLTCAILGLQPNTELQHCYLIPQEKSKEINGNWIKVWIVEFQMGYHGIIEMAQRTGIFEYLDANEVYENDEFYYEYGLHPKLKHIPTRGEKGNITDFYAVYRLLNGGYGFKVMSNKDVEEHGKTHSNSYNSNKSAWKKNRLTYIGMGKKTLLKKVLKYAPSRMEIQKQIDKIPDENIKKDISNDIQENWTPEDVINTPQEPPANTEISEAVMDAVIDEIKQ